MGRQEPPTRSGVRERKASEMWSQEPPLSLSKQTSRKDSGSSSSPSRHEMQADALRALQAALAVSGAADTQRILEQVETEEHAQLLLAYMTDRFQEERAKAERLEVEATSARVELDARARAAAACGGVGGVGGEAGEVGRLVAEQHAAIRALARSIAAHRVVAVAAHAGEAGTLANGAQVAAEAVAAEAARIARLVARAAELEKEVEEANERAAEAEARCVELEFRVFELEGEVKAASSQPRPDSIGSSEGHTPAAVGGALEEEIRVAQRAKDLLEAFSSKEAAQGVQWQRLADVPQAPTKLGHEVEGLLYAVRRCAVDARCLRTAVPTAASRVWQRSSAVTLDSILAEDAYDLEGRGRSLAEEEEREEEEEEEVAAEAAAEVAVQEEKEDGEAEEEGKEDVEAEGEEEGEGKGEEDGEEEGEEDEERDEDMEEGSLAEMEEEEEARGAEAPEADEQGDAEVGGRADEVVAAATAEEREAVDYDARWREWRLRGARDKLVEICISLKEAMLLQLVFGRWATLRLESHAAHTHFAIFESLEESRHRLTKLLHESQRENRWHRQQLSSSFRHKQLLLCWCERPLQRFWLLWTSHIMRKRLERDNRDQVRQLAYALRVATGSLPEDADPDDSDLPEAVKELNSGHMFEGYLLERCWKGWVLVVAQARLRAEHLERAGLAIREGLRGAAVEAEREASPSKAAAAAADDNGGLLGWIGSGLQQLSFDRAAAAVVAAIDSSRRRLTLGQYWLMWRGAITMEESRYQEDNERMALVVSLWNATTSGLMDSSAGFSQTEDGNDPDEGESDSAPA